jgi:hypothetical protein
MIMLDEHEETGKALALAYFTKTIPALSWRI